VGKLEGDPMTVQGYYNVCRDSYTKTDLQRGLFFDFVPTESLDDDAVEDNAGHQRAQHHHRHHHDMKHY